MVKLSLLDAVGKMSSSRIIKSQQQEVSDISDFSFRELGRLASLTPPEKHLAAFTPMDIIRESSGFTPDKSWEPDDLIPESESPPEEPEPVEVGPPTLSITEEDLDQRIKDSFNSGLQEGKELAERGLDNVFKTLRAAGETIHDLREKVLREAEDELITLIMLVARKVIVREIAEDRSILVGVVHHAIAGLSDREEITVRINHDDYLLVTQGREDRMRNELLSDRLQLKPDQTVASGFCQVDTVIGTIDAGMDAQMEEIYRHLIEQRSASSVEGN